MPFITETLWQRLPFPVRADRCEFLAIAPWPLPHPRSTDEAQAMSRFDLVRDAVSAVRQIRSDYAIRTWENIDVVIQSAVNAALFTEHSALDRPAVALDGDDRRDLIGGGAGAAHAVLADGSEVIVPLGGLVDLAKECGKLRSELGQLDAQLESLSARLQNGGFLESRPRSGGGSRRRKKQENGPSVANSSRKR